MSLSKFSQIKIDPSKNLLKGEDFEFCTKVDRDYVSAYQFFELANEFANINNESNQFLEFEDYKKSIELKTQELNQNFIEKIVHHFKDKYKISLEQDVIVNKIFGELEYRHYNRWDRNEKSLQRKITLNEILNPIQEFLGGLTLEEKAERELKENFYENFSKLYHHDKPRVNLIKNRIEFSLGRFCFESGRDGYRFTYHSQNMAMKFFLGLSFFENEVPQIHQAFSKICNNMYVENLDLLSEMSFDLDKIKTVRFYKNGKATVKFESDDIAKEFFKTMCKEGI